MFMRAETFERRMQILKRRAVPVISLAEAVKRFQQGAIENAETVITFDDGWSSTLSIGAPILERFKYPACVYVTTEHLEVGAEVFNVALSYMIRRSGRQTIELVGLHPKLDGIYDVVTSPDAAIRALIIAAEEAYPLAARQRLLPEIARVLGFDIKEVLRDGRFQLLSTAELQALAQRGMDIELHTHSHRLPRDKFELMAREIEQNREALSRVLGTRPRHFCYPSGDHGEEQPEWLRKLGIESATTCDPGLNDDKTSIMLLKRFLDSEQTSDLEFEAEICGVRELLRRLRSSPRRLLGFGAS